MAAVAGVARGTQSLDNALHLCIQVSGRGCHFGFFGICGFSHFGRDGWAAGEQFAAKRCSYPSGRLRVCGAARQHLWSSQGQTRQSGMRWGHQSFALARARARARACAGVLDSIRAASICPSRSRLSLTLPALAIILAPRIHARLPAGLLDVRTAAEASDHQSAV